MKTLLEKRRKLKEKYKKGFTLIELLAVIVILAIILIITVPTVLNSVATAKKKSLANVANIFQKEIKKYYDSIDLASAGVLEQNEALVELCGEDGSKCNADGTFFNEQILDKLGYKTEDIDPDISYVKKESDKICVSLYPTDGGKFASNDGNGVITCSDGTFSDYEPSIYYVSNGGNDSNKGTKSYPFKTLLKAISTVEKSEDNYNVIQFIENFNTKGTKLVNNTRVRNNEISSDKLDGKTIVFKGNGNTILSNSDSSEEIMNIINANGVHIILSSFILANNNEYSGITIQSKNVTIDFKNIKANSTINFAPNSNDAILNIFSGEYQKIDNQGGIFNIYDGTFIKKNTCETYSSINETEVPIRLLQPRYYLTGETIVNMYGGTIKTRVDFNDGKICLNSIGVYMQNGNFNMYGGKIEGGFSYGIYLEGAVDSTIFNMYGGDIKLNQRGVYPKMGKIYMYDGNITNNKKYDIENFNDCFYYKKGSYEKLRYPASIHSIS